MLRFTNKDSRDSGEWYFLHLAKHNLTWFLLNNSVPQYIFILINSESTLLKLTNYILGSPIGISQGPAPVLDMKEEFRSPISVTNLFQVVADDLLTLNKNLQSVSTSVKI